jgi:hypothetical protein
MKAIPKELFQIIKSDKLKHLSSSNTIVDSGDLNILYSTENNLSKCVGFKGNYSTLFKEPFFLQHVDLYERTMDLYKATFQFSKPELIAYFYSEEKDWMCFLFADTSYRERALNKGQSNTINKSAETISDMGFPFEKIMDYGFFPVIGVTNDFGFDKNPAWYLLLAQTNQTDDQIFNETININKVIENKNLNDNQENIESNGEKNKIYGDSLHSVDSYICIEKSAFVGRGKLKYSDTYFSNHPNINKFYGEIIDDCSKKFETELNNFIEILDTFSTKKINQEIFCSIVLDLYNLNIKITTNKSDTDLNRIVRKTYSDSLYFVKKYIKDPKWTDFITYVIRNKYMGFNNIKFEHVIDVLQEKNFFKTFIKRFNGFYKGPESDFISYCDEQMDAVSKLKGKNLL